MSVVDNSSSDDCGGDAVPGLVPFDFEPSVAMDNSDAVQYYWLASGPSVMFVVV